MEDFRQYYLSAMEYCKKGDFKNGISDFDKAIAINSNHIESLYNRAKAKFKIRLFSECLADFDLALAVTPDNPVLLSERAVVFYHMGEKNKAMADLDTAVLLEPSNSYRYASRAYIKDKTGDFLGAIGDYQKAIELDPEDAISYNNKGLVEEKLGYINRSKESFKKADSLTGFENGSDNPPLNQSLKEKVASQEITAKKKPTFKQYLKVVEEIFTSRSGRNDFLSYLIDLFKGKK